MPGAVFYGSEAGVMTLYAYWETFGDLFWSKIAPFAEKTATIDGTTVLTLTNDVTPDGVVTATMSFDTGKTSKGKAVIYKATCSTTVIPLSAADAEEFEGVAFVYFAPSPANGFPGFAGAAPL